MASVTENYQNMDLGHIHFKWLVDEYHKHLRSRNWYILAIFVAFIMMLFSFFTSNFLFAVIIIIAALIFIIHDGRSPEKVTIQLTDEGVVIGRKFYDYDELKNFAVVYKPRQELKNLYFEFKNVFKQRLSIPLENKDPLPIREYLLKYLPEDLDRTDAPLSEQLAGLFKL